MNKKKDNKQRPKTIKTDKVQKETVSQPIQDQSLDLEKSFWTQDGQVLRTLGQAVQYLEKVKEAISKYHINEKKNDFANWIKNVYQKKQVAEKIEKIKDPKQIAKIIKEELLNIKK